MTTQPALPSPVPKLSEAGERFRAAAERAKQARAMVEHREAVRPIEALKPQ